MSETKLCTLKKKTEQKDKFITRLSVWKLGNLRLQEQWVLSYSQTKVSLWGTCERYLTFTADWLPACLVVFSIWIRVAESGELGSLEMVCTGLAFGDCLVSSAISEKSYEYQQHYSFIHGSTLTFPILSLI